MADFDKAFELTMKAEGGYINDPDDPGGETYKGIARTKNPKWSGWVNLDILKTRPNFPENLKDNPDLQEKVKSLYKGAYWDKIQGDKIVDQDIAESIFDFAVNSGPRTSAKLAQIVVQAEPDGVIGPITLEKLNTDDKRAFLALFALAKIGRYVNLCDNRKENRKYFFGWIKRTLEGI
jgi:lysozyme family protein